MVGSSKKRALSPFNLFMKSELVKIKQANPSINHMVAFKQAAHNWKSKGHSFNVPKKGQPSKTRKGRLDFVTHKGDKFFNRKGHRQSKNRKGTKKRPYKKN